MVARDFSARAWTLAALAFCVALAGCAAGAPGEASATPQPTLAAGTADLPTVTPMPTPTDPAGQALLRAAQGAVGSAASVGVTYDVTQKQLVVTLTITGDVPTTDAAAAIAVARAQTLTFQEQHGMWASGQPLSSVTVTVMGPAQDPYDGIIYQVYTVATVSAATARRIPWPSATPASAWSLYDQTFLRPGFVVQDHTLPDATATPGG